MAKAKRNKVSHLEIFTKFPTDKEAENWFIRQRWGDSKPSCPKCGSLDTRELTTPRKLRTWRCRDCVRNFTVKTDFLMHDSKLGCQKWLIALYLTNISLKGTASIRLASDLSVGLRPIGASQYRLVFEYADSGGIQ